MAITAPMKERTMEQTPTWAIAVVCLVLLAVSIFIEHILHMIGSWLKRKHKRALYEALEKIKAELMLLGFLSLLLAMVSGLISGICVSQSIGDSWHPCSKSEEKYDTSKNEDDNGRKLLSWSDSESGSRRILATRYDQCAEEGKVAFVSYYAIYQLHKFIFVLAIFHVAYCVTTLALGRTKMRKWRAWEDETKTIEYQYSHDPDRFRFTRDTSFGRRHLNFWSESSVLLWIVSFFRQFFRSVDKVDYLTLRHGFITAHLAPGSETKFDFQKYISRSLEEDFIVVVGITPIIWFFSVLFLLSSTYGWYSYLWLPFIPLIIILLVGAKLQVIITKMGLRIQERGDVVRGAPVVQPGDDLFWFNRPGFILFLINFVLFQNAFQLAFFVFSAFTFGLRSCYHKRLEDVIIRVSMGVIIQFVCSYVTLPLYALVTQMGSTMRPTIFNDRVAAALRSWHHTAKKHTRHGRHSESGTPLTSRPGTPTHGMSPIHLLHNYRGTSDSPHASPRYSNYEADHWDAENSTTPLDHGMDSQQYVNTHFEQRDNRQETIELTSAELPPGPRAIRTHHEIDMNSSEFSFEKRERRS